jgi:hypothetical protein
MIPWVWVQGGIVDGRVWNQGKYGAEAVKGHENVEKSSKCTKNGRFCRVFTVCKNPHSQNFGGSFPGGWGSEVLSIAYF